MLITRTERKLSRWARGLHCGGLLIAVAAGGLMLGGIILPLMEQTAEIVEQEVKLRNVLELEEILTRENERLTQTLAEADQKIQSLLDRIPNVARESDFLGQITTLAKQVSVISW